jgi:hypothetical protein
MSAESVPTPAAPAAATVAAPAPAPAPAAPQQPQTVTIPLDQLQTFTAIQARLAQIETDNRAREQQAQQDQAVLLAKKGEVENALNLLRQQSEQQLANERAQRSAVEERAKRYALDGEVSRVLASQPLVPGGAEQLTQLWRSQFTVEPQGDSFSVRTPTFQSVGDFVTAQLALPQYAHFIRASNPGGGTGAVNPAGQSAPTAAANQAAPPAPRNISDAILLGMQAQQKNAVDPRLSGASSVGDDGAIIRGRSEGFGLRPLARKA